MSLALRVVITTLGWALLTAAGVVSFPLTILLSAL